MRQTKLYKALVQLNGFELNRLHRFVLSPYFNQNEYLVHLFELIKNDLKNPVGPEPTKEQIWLSLYGSSVNYNDGRFRKLQSDLLNLTEEFYAQEVFEANPVHRANYLLEAVYRNSLTELKSSTLKSAKLLVESQPLRPASFYYYQYEIEQSIYYINRAEAERNSKSNIEEIAQNLDRFYLAEKLRYYCTILNHQHLAVLNYKMLFIDEIIEHVKLNKYEDIPPITIYFTILLSYTEPDNIEHYFKIKNLIDHHIHIFPEIEVKEILDSALNYCIKKMNSGQTQFVQEAFSLYQSWLERGLLEIKGRIDPFHFKNIVTLGLRLSEFDWIEYFIHTYSSLLDDRHRSNAVTFNLAQLFFYRKDYPNVISKLSQVEYEDDIYNLNSKTFLMASYYELDEIEALNSLLDTFRVFLTRKSKIPEERRRRYLNTIRIVRKMAKINTGDLKAIHKLEREIEEIDGITSKNWIMEKLEALKEKAGG